MNANPERFGDVVLAIDHLRVLYGKHCVLHVPTLRLVRGELLLLRGPNACGKSSLLLGLAGIGPRLNGEVKFLETDLAVISAARRARMGLRLLPQDRRIFSRLTAKEHMALSERQFGKDSRVSSIEPSSIRRLWESGRPVESASGGEAKLLLLHALLTTKPKLLMLDEPFAHLDAHKSEQILRLIQEAHRLEMAIMLADHTGYAIDGLPLAQRFIISSNHCLVRE